MTGNQTVVASVKLYCRKGVGGLAVSVKTWVSENWSQGSPVNITASEAPVILTR